jgi:hypothetical protein
MATKSKSDYLDKLDFLDKLEIIKTKGRPPKGAQFSLSRFDITLLQKEGEITKPGYKIIYRE